MQRAIAWGLLFGLCAGGGARAEDERARRIREELENELRKSSESTQPVLTIIYEGLADKGYELVLAEVSVDGKPVEHVKAEALKPPGRHRISSGPVEPGQHELKARVRIRQEIAILGQGAGYVWDLSVNSQVQAQPGLEILLKLYPKLDPQEDEIERRLKLRCDGYVRMIAKVAEGTSVPPVPSEQTQPPPTPPPLISPPPLPDADPVVAPPPLPPVAATAQSAPRASPPPGVSVRTNRIEPARAVRFAQGKPWPSEAAAASIRDVAETIQALQVKRVRVIGHADSHEQKEFGKGLSLARAQKVVDLLAGAGVDASRLEPFGEGDAKPVAPNLTPRGREMNRRVEFLILER